MDIIQIINKKRLKEELKEEEIKYVIENFTNDFIKDYQMSSLLMAICINGMTDKEINYFTKYMIESGTKIDLSIFKDRVVDKHSTGGVGDKTTLVIAPLVASCGVKVAKMSGRGLGHTGGTIDKLESIPSYKVNLTEKQFIDQIKKINVAIVSQTKDIAVADKKIYALRDVTGTVESIPLIASSIMSKKIALGADYIVLDIKIGKGALIKNIEDGRKLAQIMINIGKYYKKKVVCLLTDMNIPLGNSIGNAKEIEEAILVLNQKGEKKLTNLCIELATHMVSLGLEIKENEARQMVLEKLENKEAYKRFLKLIEYQKGDLSKLPKAKYEYEVKSKINGYLTNIDAYKLGTYCLNLGCGRKEKEDKIDYSAGIVLQKNINDYVNTNDLLLKVYTNKKIDNFDDILSYFEISSKKIKEKEVILEIIK